MALVLSKPQTQKILSIDIETYSPVDIKKSGVYAYSAHPDFEVMLFAYAFDGGPVRVVDLTAQEELPEEVLTALTDPAVLKRAYNVSFERCCLSRMLQLTTFLPPEQWECTMVKAAMLGYPFGLDATSKAMGLPQEKMTEGKALIRYFCSPCKPTKTNGEILRNTRETATDKWETFKKYCMQDVVVERSIQEKIGNFTLPEQERALYSLDAHINDRGIKVDVAFINQALDMDSRSKERLIKSAASLTNLSNPNSPAQLKAWLTEEMGVEISSLSKETIKELLLDVHSKEVAEVLRTRQEMAKTSTKKYEAMLNAVCPDGRVRGLLQFYGANRTGRWAGRLVQVQNLPQNHIEDLDLARETVLIGDSELVSLYYGNIPDTLSQLIRTAFVSPQPGEFIVADFSAIEARVIAWLADEKWRQEVFATHGKIYEASAAAMFSVPIESVKKGSALRQKGKIAELALGYQGGVGALVAMGALKMGLLEEELLGIVNAWRGANRAIVRLWAEVGRAALKAVEGKTTVPIRHGVAFIYKHSALYIKLPSGRELIYQQPFISENKFGSKTIKYKGLDQITKQWCELETYGGKLVENIVQAIARDCLGLAMLRLESAGYRIVMHIHDEVVIEETKGASLEGACKIMGAPIDWAPGLLLRADGYTTPYYKKD